MLGQRVKALRKRHRLSQGDLAEMVGTSPSQISVIENNRTKPSLSVAIAISRALGSSLDFLTGEVDDNRRATVVQADNRRLQQKLDDIESGRTADGFAREGAPRHLGIRVRDSIVGSRTVVRKSVITARIQFPWSWLSQEELMPRYCEIIGVVGESMAPTLPDGCSILVNERNTDLEDGRIFVIDAGEELLARRAQKRKGERWVLTSDNPDKKAWPTIADVPGRILGEVRWMWRSLP